MRVQVCAECEETRRSCCQASATQKNLCHSFENHSSIAIFVKASIDHVLDSYLLGKSHFRMTGRIRKGVTWSQLCFHRGFEAYKLQRINAASVLRATGICRGEEQESAPGPALQIPRGRAPKARKWAWDGLHPSSAHNFVFIMPDSDTIRSASESLCVVEEGFLSGRNGSRCLDVLDMAAQSSNLSNASAYRPAWSSAYSFQCDTWLNACQNQAML